MSSFEERLTKKKHDRSLQKQRERQVPLFYNRDSGTDRTEAAVSAVRQDPTSLQWLPSDLRSNIDVVLAAVETSGLALEYASDDLKSDKEVVLAAVEKEGAALRFASPELRVPLQCRRHPHPQFVARWIVMLCWRGCCITTSRRRAQPYPSPSPSPSP